MRRPQRQSGRGQEPSTDIWGSGNEAGRLEETYVYGAGSAGSGRAGAGVALDAAGSRCWAGSGYEGAARGRRVPTQRRRQKAAVAGARDDCWPLRTRKAAGSAREGGEPARAEAVRVLRQDRRLVGTGSTDSAWSLVPTGTRYGNGMWTQVDARH